MKNISKNTFSKLMENKNQAITLQGDYYGIDIKFKKEFWTKETKPTPYHKDECNRLTVEVFGTEYEIKSKNIKDFSEEVYKIIEKAFDETKKRMLNSSLNEF